MSHSYWELIDICGARPVSHEDWAGEDGGGGEGVSYIWSSILPIISGRRGFKHKREQGVVSNRQRGSVFGKVMKSATVSQGHESMCSLTQLSQPFPWNLEALTGCRLWPHLPGVGIPLSVYEEGGAERWRREEKLTILVTYSPVIVSGAGSVEFSIKGLT